MPPSDRPSRAGNAWRLVTFVLLLATGIALFIPGVRLIQFGGSAYYAIAGLSLTAAAVLVLLRRREGLHLYALIFLGTLIWAVWEVGVDGWSLMPRLVFLAVGGLWLLLPPVRRSTRPAGHVASLAGRTALALSVLGLVAIPVVAVATAPRLAPLEVADGAPLPAAAGDGDWAHYGNTLGGTRYSPLAEITPANADRLEQAWVFHAGATRPGGTRKGGLQVTPLMVDGTLYGCTAFSSVFALDPVTGKQLWRHDPVIADEKGGHPVCRGMAFFRAPPGTADCPTRLILGQVDNKLVALDARTGQPCRSFGTNGETSLQDNMGNWPHGWYHPTSPPTIVNGTAVIGHYIVDNQSTQVPPGVIRGYDAVTGRIKWAFDPARPDDTAPLPPGRNYTPSTPNSWTIFSGDEALGLVYVPMGNGSPDFVGQNRDASVKRFGAALVALDAATGRVRWTFQAVHNDLWDYDLAAQPVLVDMPVGGGTVPALILPTKTGQVFVLDRRTGRPITRVEEKPVPASPLPGERTSPTQPFSVGMPDFIGDELTERDMWGMTPFDQLACRIRFKQAFYQGVYTPMRLGPTVRLPGELGGIDWGSVSVDPRRGLLLVNSNMMADYDALIPRAQAVKEGLVARTTATGHFAPGGAMEGTPYAVHWGAFLTGAGVPCQRPPYGYLTAIDLKTRQVAWKRRLGDARNSGPWGLKTYLPILLGAPNIGGSVTTGGGLVFIAATQDEMMRAIDVGTGRVVWQTLLPAGGHATPMTYRGRDGHQYVLIAAGGGSLKDKGGDAFVAFRLKS